MFHHVVCSRGVPVAALLEHMEMDDGSSHGWWWSGSGISFLAQYRISFSQPARNLRVQAMMTLCSRPVHTRGVPTAYPAGQ